MCIRDRNTLYIGNLPAGMETITLQTQLQNLLSLHHDGIEDIKIPEGKCFAFVTMRSEVEATMVINSIHDFPLSLSGQKLGVGYAKGKAAASSVEQRNASTTPLDDQYMVFELSQISLQLDFVDSDTSQSTKKSDETLHHHAPKQDNKNLK